ncbi:uncharacterized protein LOC136026505 isoform X2 [Artemia franciscana]|uniref:uncharacterized protein LOC136026505 isoform X2 n=1 Tax=Artemia franciscana TaxID=6661 RepID=UPI0032DABFCF
MFIRIMPKIRYSNHPIIVVPFNPDSNLTNPYSFDEEGDSFHSDPKYLETLLIESLDPDHDLRKYPSQDSHSDSYNDVNNYQGQRQRPISGVWPFFLNGNKFGFSLLKRQDGLSTLNEKPSAYSLAAVGISVYLAYALFSGGFGRSTRRILKEAKQKSGTAVRGGAIEASTVEPSIAISQLYDTYEEKTSSLPPIKVKLTKEKQQEQKQFSREFETAEDFFTKIQLQENDLPVPKEILSFEQTSFEPEAKLPIKLPIFSDKLNSSEKIIPFLLQSNSDSRVPSNIYSKIFDKVPSSTEPNSNKQINWMKDFNSIRKRIKASESLELFSNNSKTMVQQVDNPEDFQSLPRSSWTEDPSRSTEDHLNSHVSDPFLELVNSSANNQESSLK